MGGGRRGSPVATAPLLHRFLPSSLRFPLTAQCDERPDRGEEGRVTACSGGEEGMRKTERERRRLKISGPFTAFESRHTRHVALPPKAARQTTESFPNDVHWRWSAFVWKERERERGRDKQDKRTENLDSFKKKGVLRLTYHRGFAECKGRG